MKRLWALLIFTFIIAACRIDQGLEPTRSGLSGTVRFKKQWPASTDQVMVVAATKFPPTAISDIVMSEPLPTFVDSAQYVIWTSPMTFAAVGVVWKEKDQPWDVTNIIGIYFPTSNYFSPGQVVIPDKKTLVQGIDITADLSKARPKTASAIQGMLVAKGVWPPAARQVLVIASPLILPTGLLDIIFSPPIPAGFDSTAFSISVPPGTYRLIGALLIEENKNIGVESIKAVYKKRPSDLLPAAVGVPNDTTVVRGIRLVLDFGGTLP
ncbi:MAG: hypothetical protein ONA69_09980 [candidate division KSB1 bacterium]|nr:hypothetical protein [candidate division KSB1 bacterium]MDZ7347105.1 hypothetical protein [candidate division KSB1 bacterium]